MQTQSSMIAQMQVISHNYILARTLLRNITYQFDGELDIHACTDIVFKVNKAFLSLTEQEKVFINNEFFHEAYMDWWKKIYTEKEYLSFLKKTVQRFLEAYYEIL